MYYVVLLANDVRLALNENRKVATLLRTVYIRNRTVLLLYK